MRNDNRQYRKREESCRHNLRHWYQMRQLLGDGVLHGERECGYHQQANSGEWSRASMRV